MKHIPPNAPVERIDGPKRAPADVPQYEWDQFPDWLKFRIGADRTPGLSELMDVKALAQLLDCSPRHVVRQADAGRMPKPLKIGHLTRWSRQTINAWVSAGCPAVRSK